MSALTIKSCLTNLGDFDCSTSEKVIIGAWMELEKNLKAGDLNFHRHHHWLCQINPYILKAKKFAEPPFQSKKIAEKVHKLWRQF